MERKRRNNPKSNEGHVHVAEILITYKSLSWNSTNTKWTTICLLNFKTCLKAAKYFPHCFSLMVCLKEGKKIVQEVMQEWVLRVGDANIEQKEKESVSFREPACQPVGIICNIHLWPWNQTHPHWSTQTDPIPKRKREKKKKQKTKQMTFPPCETHLLSLQSRATFPLKMEIRLRQEEILTAGHHLRMPFTFRTGTSFVYICLSLIAWDAHLSRCVT